MKTTGSIGKFRKYGNTKVLYEHSPNQGKHSKGWMPSPKKKKKKKK